MPIHPQTQIGFVHYNVSNLQMQIEFYCDTLGFELRSHAGETATLGTSRRELLRLTEVPGARRVRGTTGLYHTAFIVPTRRQLAHLLQRLIESRTPIQGTSNHGTHLAIYLPDPEGNGIELAWDFPQSDWPLIDGMPNYFNMPREGVDVDALLAELNDDHPPWAGLDPNTRVGHIHLHVSDLESAKNFYNQLIGFDVMLDGKEMGAVFVSAGGYHHHIGMNVWKGIGAPPPPGNATGLHYFTVELPDKEQLDRRIRHIQSKTNDFARTDDGVFIRDPARNQLLLTHSA